MEENSEAVILEGIDHVFFAYACTLAAHVSERHFTEGYICVYDKADSRLFGGRFGNVPKGGKNQEIDAAAKYAAGITALAKLIEIEAKRSKQEEWVVTDRGAITDNYIVTVGAFSDPAIDEAIAVAYAARLERRRIQENSTGQMVLSEIKSRVLKEKWLEHPYLKSVTDCVFPPEY